MGMRISWITGRRAGSDLASSTERGISRSVEKMGYKIHMISPGNEDFGTFRHSRLEQSKVKGLQTISASRNCLGLLRRDKELIDWSEVFIIDWRFVPGLWKELKKSGKPWFVIDRGPPAYSGILARLQSFQWRRAWGIASKNATGGFVVSPTHEDFVRMIVGDGMKIASVPAGTNVEEFNFHQKCPRNIVKFVYCGRLDFNRGMDKIIRLLDTIENLPIKAKITIAGSGDWEREIRRISDEEENLDFLGKVGFKEICKLLEESHVGIMPMPDTKIWRTSSPLKLAEYLASGLIIVGPKHQGNSLDGENSWSLLSEGKNWHEDCIGMISELLKSNSWKGVSEQSRMASEKLDWGGIGGVFIQDLRSMMGQSL